MQVLQAHTSNTRVLTHSQICLPHHQVAFWCPLFFIPPATRYYTFVHSSLTWFHHFLPFLFQSHQLTVSRWDLWTASKVTTPCSKYGLVPTSPPAPPANRSKALTHASQPTIGPKPTYLDSSHALSLIRAKRTPVPNTETIVLSPNLYLCHVLHLIAFIILPEHHLSKSRHSPRSILST